LTAIGCGVCVGAWTVTVGAGSVGRGVGVLTTGESVIVPVISAELEPWAVADTIVTGAKKPGTFVEVAGIESFEMVGDDKAVGVARTNNSAVITGLLGELSLPQAFMQKISNRKKMYPNRKTLPGLLVIFAGSNQAVNKESIIYYCN